MAPILQPILFSKNLYQ